MQTKGTFPTTEDLLLRSSMRGGAFDKAKLPERHTVFCNQQNYHCGRFLFDTHLGQAPLAAPATRLPSLPNLKPITGWLEDDSFLLWPCQLFNHFKEQRPYKPSRSGFHLKQTWKGRCTWSAPNFGAIHDLLCGCSETTLILLVHTHTSQIMIPIPSVVYSSAKPTAPRKAEL